MYAGVCPSVHGRAHNASARICGETCTQLLSIKRRTAAASGRTNRVASFARKERNNRDRWKFENGAKGMLASSVHLVVPSIVSSFLTDSSIVIMQEENFESAETKKGSKDPKVRPTRRE